MMKAKLFIGMMVMLMTSAGMTACDNDDNVVKAWNPEDSSSWMPDTQTNARTTVYGEWRLVGWYESNVWYPINKKMVDSHHFAIQIKETCLIAFSYANEGQRGKLTIEGNELHFSEEVMCWTEVGTNLEGNDFFENNLGKISSYELNGNQLKLYYAETDYFLFTSNFDS